VRLRRPKPATIAAVAVAVLAVGATPAAAKLVQFRTPSSNIGCVGETTRADNVVRCDIATRNWSPPRRPAACTLDWGQGLLVERTGRARFVCAGDTALNRGRVVAYGRRVAVGAIVCTSRRSGLTCVNLQGHGFTLSRQGYRRF
jgi:hypothetical protein